MKKYKMWIFPGAILLAAFILFVAGGRNADESVSTRAVRPSVAVEIAPVQRGAIEERRILTGSLQAGARFDLSTQIAGRLESLKVDLGDRIERGQVVARLDDDKYRFEREQARAELEVARANLAEAQSTLETRRREYDRVARLREQRVASESELDSIRAEYQAQQARVRVASAQVTQREAALMGAELMLSYTVIRADWQGDDNYRVVGERYADEGSYLAAHAPLISVVAIDRLTAVAYATEADYPRLSLGRNVQVSADAVPGRRFSGRLVRLAPVVRETSRQARVEIEVKNPEQILKPGMFVRLEIELDRKDDAVIIPRSALVERPGQRAVYMADLDNGLARFIEVELGLQARDYVEIRRPLLEGYVITLGQHLLSDGASIILPGSDGAGESGSPEGRP